MSDQKNKGRWGIVTAVLVILKKQGILIKALKAVKLLKVAKPVVMVLSILMSVLAYGWLYGSWWFAGGFVAMIFIHEMGHVVALRREGLPPSPMVFIPFLGAAIFIPEMKSRQTEAIIGIGGPILGTIGAVATFALWSFLPGQHDILLLVSYIGIVLNLFNMIPISPLDGGRITQVCGTWFKYVGLFLVISLLIVTREPAILLIVVLVLDAFSSLPRWWRPTIAWMLTAAMVVLFYLGYGEQHWVIDIVDTVFALFFSIAFTATDTVNIREEKKYDDDGMLTKAIRVKWFFYWAALVVFLVGMLVVQAPLLPKEILENARIRAE